MIPLAGEPTVIEIRLNQKEFDYELQALVNSFSPGQRSVVRVEESTDIECEQMASEEPAWLIVQVRMDLRYFDVNVRLCHGKGEDCVLTYHGEPDVVGDFRKKQTPGERRIRTQYKNEVKAAVFTLLEKLPVPEYLPQIKWRIPGWGTMTGVRPTKIPMNMLEQGCSPEEVCQVMRQQYHCGQEQARLSISIAQRELELMNVSGIRDGYSLYIGIPFCPTTCLYCSFASYPCAQFGHMIPEYMEALHREIQSAAERFRGQKLRCIYVGGGTPTALDEVQLGRLMEWIHTYFAPEDLFEFTVEAGRPDSITGAKLQVLRDAGVTRISVNPQTMQQRTLDLIGRRHTVEQTVSAFEMARKVGFDDINMDLIAGLPGETAEDFADTLRQIDSLQPDSITVHSLVIKRASRLRQVLDEGTMPEREREEAMEQMQQLAREYAVRQGMEPYYMYRQKNSAGHGGSTGQENIGYAAPGKSCLYNILIMEEKQTILALGAGASTKVYEPEQNRVYRIENVKSVKDYIERIDEMIHRKDGIGS